MPYKDKNEQKAWRKKNRNKVRVHEKRWREKNKGKVRAYSKQHREKHEDQLKAKNQKWYSKNKDKVKARARKWYRDNRDRTRVITSKWRKANKARIKVCATQRKYGLSVEDQQTLERQNECAICGTCRSSTKMVFDHDHATGSFRGLLCNNCNWGLGNFKDNIGLLQKAIEYLKGTNK